MATKIYCDGCDEEIKPFNAQKNNIKVTIEDRESAMTHAHYELCRNCIPKMQREADPKLWKRYDAPERECALSKGLRRPLAEPAGDGQR